MCSCKLTSHPPWIFYLPTTSTIPRRSPFLLPPSHRTQVLSDIPSPQSPTLLRTRRLSEGTRNMRNLSGIGELCTRARLPCIARITILDFTLLAQWTPPDIPSSWRFSDSQRVLAICATSLGSVDRVLVLD